MKLLKKYLVDKMKVNMYSLLRYLCQMKNNFKKINRKIS